MHECVCMQCHRLHSPPSYSILFTMENCIILGSRWRLNAISCTQIISFNIIANVSDKIEVRKRTRRRMDHQSCMVAELCLRVEDGTGYTMK